MLAAVIFAQMSMTKLLRSTSCVDGMVGRMSNCKCKAIRVDTAYI